MGILNLIDWPVLIIIAILILAIFVITLICAISNFRNGIRYLWPPRYIVGFIIFSVVSIAILVATTIFAVYIISSLGVSHDHQSQSNHSVSNSGVSLLFNTFKYWLIARL